jgi:hypothetical protein
MAKTTRGSDLLTQAQEEANRQETRPKAEVRLDRKLNPQ